MSMQSVARKFRSAIKVVAKEIEMETNRVSHDTLLLISARCVPSEIGKDKFIIIIDYTNNIFIHR